MKFIQIDNIWINPDYISSIENIEKILSLDNYNVPTKIPAVKVILNNETFYVFGNKTAKDIFDLIDSLELNNK